MDINSLVSISTITDDDILFVENVYDRSIKSIDFVKGIRSFILNDQFNASKLDNITIQSSSQNGSILYNNNGTIDGKIPQLSDVSFVNYNDGFLKIDNEGQVYSEPVYIENIYSSNSSNANKFIRVSSDGTQLIETDIDFSIFVGFAGDPVADLNTIDSGFFSADLNTANRPDVHEQGYAISARAINTYPAAQLYTSIDSDNLYFRNNNSTTTNNFSSWYSIYNTSNNPISDSIDLNSSTTIASSNAVRLEYNKITQFNNDFNAVNLLNLVKTVDGTGSGLNADMLDGHQFSEMDNLFVNVSGDTMTGPLTSSNSVTIKDSNNNFISLNANNSNIYLSSNKNIQLVKSDNSLENLLAGGFSTFSTYNNNIPANGILSEGIIKTSNSFQVKGNVLFDSSGNTTWSHVKNVPSNITNLGSVASKNVGTSTGEVPFYQDVLKNTNDNTMTGSLIFNGNVNKDTLTMNDNSSASIGSYANTDAVKIYGNYNTQYKTNSFNVQTYDNDNEGLIFRTNGNNLLEINDSQFIFNSIYTVWSQYNDGSGSGMDAGLFDGHDKQYFINLLSGSKAVYSYDLSSTRSGYVVFAIPNGDKLCIQWATIGFYAPPSGSTTIERTIYLPYSLSQFYSVQISIMNEGQNPYNDNIVSVVNNYSGAGYGVQAAGSTVNIYDYEYSYRGSNRGFSALVMGIL